VIYLHFIVEGQTERIFVKRILGPYLGDNFCIDASLITTSKDRSGGCVHKGGLENYQKTKRELINRLKQYKDKEHRFTTMFDLYALPNNFPGYSESQKITDPYDKVKKLEESLANDINDPRFIPYIQLYEFETMIFVNPTLLMIEYPDAQKALNALIKILDSNKINGNPELIDGGNETHPSQRILSQIPDFHKPIAGVNTVEKIGINAISAKCQHFNDWLEKLKALNGPLSSSDLKNQSL
jgi:hypothetical protein